MSTENTLIKVFTDAVRTLAGSLQAACDGCQSFVGDSGLASFRAVLLELNEVFLKSESRIRETGEISKDLDKAYYKCLTIRESHSTVEVIDGRKTLVNSFPHELAVKWEAVESAWMKMSDYAKSAFQKRGIRYRQFPKGTAPSFLALSCELQGDGGAKFHRPYFVKAAEFEGSGSLMEFPTTTGNGELDVGTYVAEASIIPEGRAMFESPDHLLDSLELLSWGMAPLSQTERNLPESKGKGDLSTVGFDKPELFEGSLTGDTLLIAPSSGDQGPRTFVMSGLTLKSDSFRNLLPSKNSTAFTWDNMVNVKEVASRYASFAAEDWTTATGGDKASPGSSVASYMAGLPKDIEHLSALVQSIRERRPRVPQY